MIFAKEWGSVFFNTFFARGAGGGPVAPVAPPVDVRLQLGCNNFATSRLDKARLGLFSAWCKNVRGKNVRGKNVRGKNVRGINVRGKGIKTNAYYRLNIGIVCT